ncbi:MAG: glycosyltransferase family 4 protein, partial [bacterium]
RKDIFYQLTNISKVYDFIFVGSFYKVKGIDLLIEAIKKIEYNLKICFIGSGPYMNDIKKLQRNSTSHIDIFYDLTQKEIMKFYNKSKFLVLPSRNDSFGLVVTEALYCGTPVIVSNMSGTKEQVADNYNGFLIRNNITELRDTMCNVLKLSPEEYNRLSANASKSNQQYSLENVTKELLKIYQR